MEQQGSQNASAVHKEHQVEPKGPQEASGELEEKTQHEQKGPQREQQGPPGGSERHHEPVPAPSEDDEVAAARLLATEKEAAELAELAAG